MGLKDQINKVTKFVGFRRALSLLLGGGQAEGWAPKEVYLKPGQVVHLRCLSDKRSSLTHTSPVAIIRMKDVNSSSFIQNYKE